MTLSIVNWESREAAAEGLADAVQENLFNAFVAAETASLAVAGGTTPGPMFNALSMRAMEWARVTVTVTDERLVPEDNPRSNARLVRETLLQNAAEAAAFIPLAPGGEAPGPDGPPGLAAMLPFDCVVLGMGEDMHTASLFPGADRLAEALPADALPVAVLRPASQPEARMSLSAPVLDGAMAKHLVIFGAGKRAALERAATLPASEAPVSAILQGMTIHWAE